MLIGYARDRGDNQSLQLQLRALSNAGCAKLFSEQKCGTSMGAQNVLQRPLDFARRGDMLVTHLDRLAPSPRDIDGILASLACRGIGFRCLQQLQVNFDNFNDHRIRPAVAKWQPDLPDTSDEKVSTIGLT